MSTLARCGYRHDVRRGRPSDGVVGWSGGRVLLGAVVAATFLGSAAGADGLETAARPAIMAIDPPEGGFYAKRLDYEGIPIKAAAEVVDEALFAARDRLALMLEHLPSVRARLRAAGAELHIIGRHQVTTDLPEWRHDKGKSLAEYNGLTRDQRTRGMGGLLASCGEENLLRLEQDRYRGRDICVHEFAHNILSHGAPRELRQKVCEQHRRSLERGLWVGAYAGSNPGEFFAELSMWYFGTRGDLGMKGAKPANGRAGLEAYDPEAFALLDDFYRGRMEPPAPAAARPSATKALPAAVMRRC
ncbi:MAG: zinc-dependent peptidase [Verrucomicrobia bacterium]|nr:zinc-dependent peptidase [Verrucomicrobiota bacterium]